MTTGSVLGLNCFLREFSLGKRCVVSTGVSFMARAGVLSSLGAAPKQLEQMFPILDASEKGL